MRSLIRRLLGAGLPRRRHAAPPRLPGLGQRQGWRVMVRPPGGAVNPN